MRPPIKWAGGKSRLVDDILKHLPRQVRGRYFEPFVGGGAVFWRLVEEGRIQRAVLADVNPELINAYVQIRDYVDALMRALNQLQPWVSDRTEFERIRAHDPDKLDSVWRAARFIFLNRTCFNGLYRVNLSGRFNVPFGRHKTPPKLYDRENILACSGALQVAEIRLADFEQVMADARAGDAIYCDPPYWPRSATASFVKYTENGFGSDDQLRLARLLVKLRQRGVTTVASNADVGAARDAWSRLQLTEVQASRAINSKGDRRGPVGELLAHRLRRTPIPKQAV